MFCFLLLPQWTFGLWAASWQRCCKENLFLKAQTVSFYLICPFLLHLTDLNRAKRQRNIGFCLVSVPFFPLNYLKEVAYVCDLSHLTLDAWCSDLDQLSEIMKTTGTPTQEFISKLESEDVSLEHASHTRT